MNPLEIVGHIEIPPAALRHAHVAEALAAAVQTAERDEIGDRVLGTENSRQVELCGWGTNVPVHHDCTGYVYLVALNAGATRLFCMHDMPGEDSDCDEGQEACVDLQPGMVVRLDDNYLHWTEDSCTRIAAFVGSFDAPCDELAVAQLRIGVDALARGTAQAPRVIPQLQMRLAA
ncbi:hypothetical protein [Cupriavidus pauculus]|uniref:hypothetical protein n=1 Tax=Cupriavidus pauculus TaxID=82633 RepID=UPI001D0C4879|nr:hypothetical protein [Cupriavidus pauculus]